MGLHFEFPPALIGVPALAAWAWWLARTSRAYLPPGRRSAALILRLAVSALLPLALAGPVLLLPVKGVDVVFLLDRSASIGPAAVREAERWLERALASKQPEDRAGLVVFGGLATVERPLDRAQELPRLPSQAEQADRTDIEAAIRAGLGLLAPDAPRRLVLFSDGQENLGSARDAARLAAAARVPVDVVPIGDAADEEVSLLVLDTPPLLREGERFSATAIVQSTVVTPARLVVATEGRLLASEEVMLRPGVNRFVLPAEPLERGTHVFRAEVEAEVDTFPANNRAGSVSVVGGPPVVLLVEGRDGAGHYLAAALQAAGLELELASPTTTAWDAATLRRYHAVLLVDVPAEALAPEQQKLLGEYVYSFGGGLVVVGGEQAYGPGGYARTPLETLLPVRMDLRGRTLSASVALVLAIDTSGSMGGGPEGSTKMDLAKEAAISAAELLGEYDQIGVIAFEDTARWAVELQQAANLSAIEEAISAMQAGGGTDVYPALVDAHQALAGLDAKVKHVILITDGQTPAKDWAGVAASLRRDNITLSTIGIGADSDFALLQQLAGLGNGRYYEGNDPFDLPRLVVKETVQIQRAAIVEEEFRPIRVLRSAVTDDLDFLAAPPLQGYVATTPKPGANVLLVSRHLDPLLSEWQYGLGRVLAWTSDARNRWAARWLEGWPDFPRFWSQVVRRAARPPDDPNRSLEVRVQDARGIVRLEAQADDRSYLNFLPTRATVLDPRGQTQEIRLPQVAPGTYEGTFELVGDGAYLVQASQEQLGSSAATQSGGVVVPYSPEYRALGVNRAMLEEIARHTGGRELKDQSSAFAPPQVDIAARDGRQLWPWLAVLAALLFLADIAVRRLRLEHLARSPFWQRARRALTPTLPGQLRARTLAQAKAPGTFAQTKAPSMAASPLSGSQRMQARSPENRAREAPVANAGRLLAAKQRVRQRSVDGNEPPASRKTTATET